MESVIPLAPEAVIECKPEFIPQVRSGKCIVGSDCVCAKAQELPFDAEIALQSGKHLSVIEAAVGDAQHPSPSGQLQFQPVDQRHLPQEGTFKVVDVTGLEPLVGRIQGGPKQLETAQRVREEILVRTPEILVLQYPKVGLVEIGAHLHLPARGSVAHQIQPAKPISR